MEIYLVGQKGIPSKVGGVEKQVEQLALHLVQRGHNVHAYTRPSYTSKSKKSFNGVKLISIPCIKTKHLEAISHTFLSCLDLAKRKTDIIHIHSIGPSSLIWLIRLLKPNTPIISTFQCKDYHHKKWGPIARTYLKFGEFASCKFPDTTITPSIGLTKYAKKKYNTNTVHIPNGVAPIEHKPANIIKKWGLTQNNYILTVSRLIEHKGIHFLIKAFNAIKTDKKLVIAGTGSYTDAYVSYLKKLAKNNKNIIFTGNQTGSTLNELFTNAYLFVQPSTSEGLSVALLESLASRNTVLVSNIPENKEVVGSLGFYFQNKNILSLKKELNHLISNPGIVKKYKKAGLSTLKKTYDWDKITKKVETTYLNSINNKKITFPLIKKISRTT